MAKDEIHWGSMRGNYLLCGEDWFEKTFYDFELCGNDEDFRKRITCEKCLAKAAEPAKMQPANRLRRFLGW